MAGVEPTHLTTFTFRFDMEFFPPRTSGLLGLGISNCTTTGGSTGVLIWCVSVHWGMLSDEDRIKADLVNLQEKLHRCSDTSLRTLLEDWIIAKKKLLAKHVEEEKETAVGREKPFGSGQH